MWLKVPSLAHHQKLNSYVDEFQTQEALTVKAVAKVIASSVV